MQTKCALSTATPLATFNNPIAVKQSKSTLTLDAKVTLSQHILLNFSDERLPDPSTTPFIVPA